MSAPPLVVLHEDRDLLVVEKPAGVHTAPLSPGETGTLLDAVISAFPEVGALPGRKAVEPGLIHRLDRETSGVVVVARTPAAFHALCALFSAGGAAKTYEAACAESDATSVDHLRAESRFAPRGPGGERVQVVPPEASPRILGAATRDIYVTEARILSRAAGLALLCARITRGFRHQLRVHLAWRGYPILGDPLYGAAVPPGAPARMYLHAARIELRHPATGMPLAVESPLPPEFGVLFGPRTPGHASGDR